MQTAPFAIYTHIEYTGWAKTSEPQILYTFVNNFSMDVTCHGSHSVTCYPTQVNALRINPSQPQPVGW